MSALKIIVLALLIGGSLTTWGTTFVPTPFEKQVMDSYGVLRGNFNGSVYKKLPSGEVVTQASFKIKESAGLKPNEVVNKNDFKVIYPGGKWQGVVYQVHGAPNFKKDEDVVLLLSKGNYGFVIKSLGLGKYNVYRKDGQYYLSSSIFSRHPKLGKILYKDFEEILSHRFGSHFKSIKDDRYVYQPPKDLAKRSSFANINKKNKGRGIASLEKNNERKPAANESQINILWLAFFFSFMGAYSLRKMTRKRKR